MPELILPDARFRVSFLDAVHEHIAEDDFFGGTLARELREHGSAWQRPEGFERYVEAVRQEEAEDGRRPEGFVPNTWYWYVDGDTYLGRIQVRHRLTPWLLDYGGHIGYGVRPGARRRGHATAMLRDVLPYARALGLPGPRDLRCHQHPVPQGDRGRWRGVRGRAGRETAVLDTNRALTRHG